MEPFPPEEEKKCPLKETWLSGIIRSESPLGPGGLLADNWARFDAGTENRNEGYWKQGV